MEVSEEEEVAHRRSGRSVLARTSGQVIGTATSTTAAPTTLLAAQTASSVVLPRMILLAAVGDTRVTCLELEVSGLAAAAAAPAAPTGNPVTGFALGEFNLHHHTHFISTNATYFNSFFILTILRIRHFKNITFVGNKHRIRSLITCIYMYYILSKIANKFE
jgi:hypothetical protein